MVTIEFRFPAGKYHATPWDKHVNEGVVEWPPAPWRILRALLFTWHKKTRKEVQESTLRSLLGKLSSLPEYYLPQVTLSHTRHYMPLFNTPKDGKTAKVFDTFASIREDQPVIVQWPDVEATEEEIKALDILLNRMGYLGRAESWVEPSRIDEIGACNCLPLERGTTKGRTVKVLTVLNEYDYQKFRKMLPPKVKAPRDVFEALHIDTGTLKKEGWSQPPGSKWVRYTLPDNAFEISPPLFSYHRDTERHTVARYALASKVPPSLTEAISVAERIHQSLTSKSDDSQVFTGKDSYGNPLEGNSHAHILLESNYALGKGRRGEITHVTIYAPMGFYRDERKAFDKLTKVWGHGGHDIHMVLLGVGNPEDFAGDITKGLCPLFNKSRVWESRTPFIPTRHPKTKAGGQPKLDEDGYQIGSPEHDLKRLLKTYNFPEPARIERIPYTDLAGHQTRWLHFRRQRKKGKGKKSTNMGFGFKIEFCEPVRGPIALGYGNHFGLGLFNPAD